MVESMINSSSSSNAPTDFKLYDSTESSHETVKQTNIICDLCSSERTPSYCIRCLNNGDFTYSNESQYNLSCHYAYHNTFINKFDQSETYSMKKQKYINLKKVVKELSERVSFELVIKMINEKKRNLICLRKKDIEILQNIIIDIRESISICKESCADVAEANANMRAKSANRVVKLSRIVDYTTDSRRRHVEKSRRLDDAIAHLAVGRCRRVRDLYSSVFPVVQTDSMIGELAEAVEIAYIDNHWVNNPPKHSRFSVCGALLPRDGEYTSFKSLLCDQYRIDHSTTAVAEDTLDVGAALGHIAQSCRLTSSILDVILPAQCDFREFTSRYLKEKRFEVLVNSLNCIVQCLCATQCVNITDSRIPCANLISLINSNNLGRIQAFQYNAKSLLGYKEDGDSCEIDDWDTVPDSSPSDTVLGQPAISLISNIWNAAISYSEKK